MSASPTNDLSTERWAVPLANLSLAGPLAVIDLESTGVNQFVIG